MAPMVVSKLCGCAWQLAAFMDRDCIVAWDEAHAVRRIRQPYSAWSSQMGPPGYLYRA